MTKAKADVLQGTLDMLILKTLESEASHGWGLSQRIQEISDEVLQVNLGGRVVRISAHTGHTPRYYEVAFTAWHGELSRSLATLNLAAVPAIPCYTLASASTKRSISSRLL